GMTVKPASAKGRVEHGGRTYYFCSKHCVHQFEKHPEQYSRKTMTPGQPPLQQIGKGSAATAAVAAATKAKDPVCGMEVDPVTAKYRLEHAGKTYYFCCGGCLEKFRTDPERYLSPRQQGGLVQLGAGMPAHSARVPSNTAVQEKSAVADQRIYV